ncbi:MAG: methyltransferase [Pyrinomonadaceae bacterium]
MSNSDAAAMQPLPPEAMIMQFATGAFVAQALWCAAALAIADHLADGPRSADALAADTDTDANSLYRMLRALASVGVFTEVGTRNFANTPISETLLTDSPMSQKAMVLMIADPEHGKVVNNMLHSVRTGKPAWEHVHGVPVFEYFYEKNKASGEIFNQAMTAFSRQTIPAILANYDFSGAGTIADIAGGVGHLLGAVLQKYPDARGVLFEIPPVLANAPSMLDSYGVSDRVELVAGDFVESIPVEADIYMLKHIIHDWYDDKNQKILGNIRESMPDNARVLIIDAVIPPGNDPHPGKILDLEMLISPGGMERTADEFESLLKNSGFQMTRIIPTPSPVGIVEAVKA